MKAINWIGKGCPQNPYEERYWLIELGKSTRNISILTAGDNGSVGEWRTESLSVGCVDGDVQAGYIGNDAGVKYLSGIESLSQWLVIVCQLYEELSIALLLFPPDSGACYWRTD